MDQPVVRINPTKPTDIDFEVAIKTNCVDDKPRVRLVVEVEEGWLLTLPCERNDETKRWSVSIPALSSIKERAEYPFTVEVILEDYFFEPAKGVLQPVERPSVDLKESRKPSVSASFGSSAEESLEERAPGTGTAHNHGASPNNRLLRPEMKPIDTHVEEPEDEDTDVGDVGSSVTPGDQGMTADTRAQPDGKGGFDARAIAQSIVQNTIKPQKKPSGKGYLFKRVGEKAVIEGLEPTEIKKSKDDKAKKVKKILESN